MDKIQIFKYSILLSINKILSVRARSIYLILIFFCHAFLSPLRTYIAAVDTNITPWIFSCLLSDFSFQLVIVFCSIYFFSDVPFFQYQEMYQMIRCGRVKWALAHILSLIETSFLFVLITFLISNLMLLPYLSLDNGWGAIIRTISLTNASQYYQIPFTISYKMLNSLTPFQATSLAIAITSLVVCMIGSLMFMVSLLFQKIYAITAATLLPIWAVIVYNMGYYSRQSLSYTAPILWMNISDIELKTYGMYILPGYKYIFITLVLLIVMMSLISIKSIKTKDCNWENEE